MSDNQVTVNQESDDGKNVLGEAAVTSAAISGVAAAQSDEARRTADEAASRAETANAKADAALGRDAGVSEERARQIADEAAESAIDRLANVLAERIAPKNDEAAISESTPEPPTPPASIQKAAKKQGKRRASDRWFNNQDEE